MVETNHTTLHIINGGAAGSVFKQATLPGDLLIWSDILHEGPVPGGMRRNDFQKLRANFLSDHGWATFFNTMSEFTERDKMLDNNRFSEYVLWMEPHLSGQLQLIQAIDTLRSTGINAEQISLVCISEHAGIDRFVGFSQLSPRNITQLFGQRESIDKSTVELACKAWRVFSGGDPTQLLTLGEASDAHLRYLDDAFRRLAQEYPSTANGLSLSQRHMLDIISQAPASKERIFHVLSDREKRPYMAEVLLDYYIDTLLEAPFPLITMQERADKSSLLTLTATGLDVLSAANDFVALNGIDKWIGGVYLRQGKPGWRYNEPLGTLMSSVL